MRASRDALREAAYHGLVEVVGALLVAMRPLVLEDTISFRGKSEWCVHVKRARVLVGVRGWVMQVPVLSIRLQTPSVSGRRVSAILCVSMSTNACSISGCVAWLTDTNSLREKNECDMHAVDL